MTIAYFQCIGGASGDMLLSALLDAGLELDDLRAALAELDAHGYELDAQRARRGGLDGAHLVVRLDAAARKSHSIQDFVNIAQASALSDAVIEKSCAVFRRLADAEAKVHRASPDDVHLHELGTLDTLVDVVGGVAGLDMLGVDAVFCSPFPAGSGVVRSAHGILPVPAPATATLFEMANAPVAPAPNNAHNTGEMVTPTGAALLTTLAQFAQPTMNVRRIGYGLGTRDPEAYPNALALWLGDVRAAPRTGGVKLIETNIDDMNGELLGYAQERLFAAGARDVWFTPIQMKKNRPAVMLSVIASDGDEAEIVKIIMRETSTLGVRVRPLERVEAERRIVRVDTSLGNVAVKLKRLDGEAVSLSPEYEDARAAAMERGIPLQDAYDIIRREAQAQLMPPR